MGSFKTSLFVGFSLVLYLYPIAFAYTAGFYFLFHLCVLWLVTFLSWIYFVSFKSNGWKKYFRFFAGIVVLGSFWLLVNFMSEKSEDLYFYTHKKKFEKIVGLIKENLLDSVYDATSDVYSYDDYIIASGNNYVAIGVRSFLDNTDGFMLFTGGEMPLAFLCGNLIFTEKIDGNWYKFSTR